MTIMPTVAIICHCNVVREPAIVTAIDCGATTLSELQEACGAATRCGGCTDAVRDLIAQHLQRPRLVVGAVA
jgi:bacterioferritin-associated ferredoxin